MPSETREVRTELTLDVQDFERNSKKAADSADELDESIQEAREDIKKMGEQAQKTGKDTESAFDKMTKKFLGWAAVLGVIKSSWQNITALDSSILRLRSNLGPASDELEAFADSFSAISSQSKAALLSLGADFSTTLRTMYSDTQTMSRVTQNVLRQVENISTSTGRTAQEVLSDFQSLATGSYDAFQKYGIDTREEILRTSRTMQEYANGRVWEQLTEREKQQIALIETMRQVDEKYQQNTDSLTYKLNRMNAAWNNTTTSLGGLLAVATPIVTFFGDVFQLLSDGLDTLNQVGDGFGLIVIGGAAFVAFAPSIIKMLTALFTGAMSTASAFMLLGSSLLMLTLLIASGSKDRQDNSSTIKNETSAVEDETKAIDDQTKATEELHKARQGLMGIDEINTMQQQGDLVVGEDGTIQVDRRSDILEEYLKLQEQITDGELGFADALRESADAASSSMMNTKAFLAVISAVTLAVTGAKLALAAYNAIKKIKAARETEDTAATQANTVAAEENTTATNAETVADESQTAAQTAENAAETAGATTDAESTAATIANTTATNAETVADTAEAAAQTASNVAEQQGVATSAQSVAASAAEATAAGTEAAAEMGAAAAHTAKNTAASWGTWAAIGIPIIIAAVGGILALTSQVKLAHGGVVGGETVATLGEGVYHEAVVPLGNSPEWQQTKEDLADYISENGGGGGNQRIETVVNLNGREMARALAVDMHDEWKRRGWTQ